MTKEQIKAKLEAIAKARNGQWHSQEVHKIAACAIVMDLAKIKDSKERDRVMTEWMALPSALGANASALAQQLGRPKAADEVAKAFAGF